MSAGGEPPRVVVLRALGLGDLLTAVPALRAVARAFPEHRRVLAAPRVLAPLVAMAAGADGPVVHEVVAAGPLERLDAVRLGPDVAVNLHGRGPQSHRLLLERCPRRLVAFAHPDVPAAGPAAGAVEWLAGEHEVRRWCRMLEGHGIPADPADLLLREVPAPPPGIPRGASVIHPGAASGARRWPADRWAAVVAAERDAGRPVVLTGSAAERALAERVAVEAGGGAVVVAGRTGLSELAGIVAGAGRVLCGDTGIAHLASALRRPSVVLFGPTSPVTWGPPADGPHEVLWAGRTGDPHAGEPDPGLLEIGAVDVLLAIDRLEARLAAAPAAHHSSCSTFQRVSASSSSGP